MAFDNHEQELQINEDIKKKNLMLMLTTQLLNLFDGSVVYRELDINSMNVEFIKSLNLSGDSKEELYLKYYMIAIIKSSSKMYKNNISKFLNIVLECMKDIVLVNPKLVYYFICTFSSFYSNAEMKKLLALTKIEETRRIGELNNNNLFRKLVS